MSEREPIGVIGTGYVGLVTAAGFAELGNEVYCIDIDAAKIEGLKQGRMPIWEPGLEELVTRHRDRLRFSTDIGHALEHARLLFVAVGTPPTYSGDADLSAVHAVVDAMPASDHHALVMKSTVPVGTGSAIRRIGTHFLKPGIGFGGSCFPKDVSALKQLAGNSGYHFQLLTAVIEVNELQKRRTIGKLQKHLGSLVNREIALLGVAFKPNTDDVREATSLVLAARLQSEGAHVRVYDPVATERARELLSGAQVCDSADAALQDADA